MRKLLISLVMVIGLIAGVTPGRAEAYNTIQLAHKCVYWPAGYGNWAIQPVWKIRIISDYYPTAMGNTGRIGTNHKDVYSSSGNFIWGIGDTGSTWLEYTWWPYAPEPYTLKIWKPVIDDYYFNTGADTSTYNWTTFFSANTVSCNPGQGTYPNW